MANRPLMKITAILQNKLRLSLLNFMMVMILFGRVKGFEPLFHIAGRI